MLKEVPPKTFRSSSCSSLKELRRVNLIVTPVKGMKRSGQNETTTLITVLQYRSHLSSKNNSNYSKSISLRVKTNTVHDDADTYLLAPCSKMKIQLKDFASKFFIKMSNSQMP